ncbi:MAG: sensor histidine kinase [Pseudomonadota bacterium]
MRAFVGRLKAYAQAGLPAALIGPVLAPVSPAETSVAGRLDTATLALLAPMVVGLVISVSLLAYYVARYRGAQESVDVLEQANERIRNDLYSLTGDLKKGEVLLREANHRFFNSLQAISSIIASNAPDGGPNSAAASELRSLLNDLRGRVRAVATVQRGLSAVTDPKTSSLPSVLESIAVDLSRLSSPPVALDLDFEDVEIPEAHWQPIALILAELIMNSIKHNAGHPQLAITASFKERSGRAQLRFSDNGRGLPDGFDLRLHRNEGLQLITDLAEDIGGELTVMTSDEKRAATFTIGFPPVRDRALSTPE